MKYSFSKVPFALVAASALLLSACNDEDKTSEKEQQAAQTSKQPVEKNTETSDEQQEQEQQKEEARDEGGYLLEQPEATEVKKVDGIVIANKRYPMPSNYAPGESTEARAAFNELNRAAKKAGYTLDAFSTYRSYERQNELYEAYKARDGQKAADRYSARPGFSEHQTGLAFDIGDVTVPGDYASNRFGKTEAGKWLAEHAHEYGFIMRYPEGKEEITGYMYESWHFRYVGVDIATEIYEEDLTLEEYLGVEG